MNGLSCVIRTAFCLLPYWILCQFQAIDWPSASLIESSLSVRNYWAKSPYRQNAFKCSVFTIQSSVSIITFFLIAISGANFTVTYFDNIWAAKVHTLPTGLFLTLSKDNNGATNTTVLVISFTGTNKRKICRILKILGRSDQIHLTRGQRLGKCDSFSGWICNF